MIINEIHISGLFGHFNHDLKFKSDERIAIMVGPNGSGKTTILRILYALFNKSYHTLSRLPFREIEVRFDDGSQLTAKRSSQSSTSELSSNVINMVLRKGKNNKVDKFTIDPTFDVKNLNFPLQMIDDVVPQLDQVGSRQWTDRLTGETLNLEDIIEKFGDDLPPIEFEDKTEIPSSLKEICDSVSVRFIDAERLTHTRLSRGRFDSRFLPSYAPKTRHTVRRYSEDLAEKINQVILDYGSLSEKLDRTFPSRLVNKSEKEIKTSSLREDLDKVEEKRARLVKAGLLVNERKEASETLPSLDKVDSSNLSVLAVYARDAMEKLEVFDDLYTRVDVFTRMVNNRFTQKEIQVSRDGFNVIDVTGSSLNLEMLSSGEQHELVILYEFLFRVPDNAFILFDEPEISLHVEWQEQFLYDLESMADISKFRVLLATHSPQIIGDRWDLTVNLRGFDNQ